jgi:hypothetical protein
MMCFVPPLDPVPAPGAYIDRRRVASGMTREQVAQRLAALPYAIVSPTPADIARLSDRIAAAELEGQHFTKPQAALLRQIFRFDVDIYLQLIDLAAAGPGCGLPVPQLCTSCACSWHVPCVTDAGPCAWSDSQANRCTHCAPAPANASAPEPELAQ